MFQTESCSARCLLHMEKMHGFFLPDVEYLQDKPGLVLYLAEKVKLGKICLYCNGKSYASYQDCQQHMLMKNHCKVLYQENHDLDEYGDFYDFSAQYEEFNAENE